MWIDAENNQLTTVTRGSSNSGNSQNTTRLFKFLTGLNPEYDTIRRDILKDEPYPSVEEAYGRVQREAAGLKIMPPASSKTAEDFSVGSADASSEEIGYGFGAQRGRPTNRGGPPRPPPAGTGHQTGGKGDKNKLWCSH